MGWRDSACGLSAAPFFRRGSAAFKTGKLITWLCHFCARTRRPTRPSTARRSFLSVLMCLFLSIWHMFHEKPSLLWYKSDIRIEKKHKVAQKWCAPARCFGEKLEKERKARLRWPFWVAVIPRNVSSKPIKIRQKRVLAPKGVQSEGGGAVCPPPVECRNSL